MLEWVSSKVVASIAVLVVLASVSGFFIIQKNAIKQEELVNITEDIARTIDKLSMIDAETSAVLHFDTDGNGLVFPSNVQGESYSIEIGRDQVRCIISGARPSALLHISVHLYSPGKVDISNVSEIRSLDIEHQKIHTTSSGNIIVIRTNVGSSGSSNFETFVFVED